MAARLTLYDHLGQPLDLGPALASGGEGAVYPLAKDATRLAKVYHHPPDGMKVEKLRWMVREAAPELCKFAAWPTATLHDTPAGPVVGFLMPRFDQYQPIHTLYSPAHRRSSFPHADWAFLIHTAANCAVAFDAIHSRGHVVGDVNQSNVLVSAQTLIGLIDCDSFQVQANGHVFRCEVGVGPYTPSELQGKNFHEVLRTPNHDRFGLAVLIFHLLFMGRHPFAGRFLGAGEMPLEKAIHEYRFVYGKNAAALQMAPPPFALPLQVVSPELAALFERAFEKGSEADAARPTATDWYAALTALEKQLRSCPQEPGHKFPALRVDCPWCAIIKGGGPNFFLGAGLVGAAFTVDRSILKSIWERVEKIPLKAQNFRLPALPVPRPKTPARIGMPRWLGVTVPTYLNRFGCLSLVVGYVLLSYFVFDGWCLSFFVCLLAYGLLNVLSVFLQRLYNAQLSAEGQRAEQLVEKFVASHLEFEQVVARYKTEFMRIKNELKAVKVRYEKLQAQFDGERPLVAATLEKDKEALQRDQFLRTQFLNEHKIKGFGSGRMVLLASYGIETAYDLMEDKLGEVRGIGPALTATLLKWKKDRLRQFTYNPDVKVAPQEVEAKVRTLVFQYKQLEESLRAQLQKGAVDLEALASQTEEDLQALKQRMEALVNEVD